MKKILLLCAIITIASCVACSSNNIKYYDDETLIVGVDIEAGTYNFVRNPKSEMASVSATNEEYDDNSFISLFIEDEVHTIYDGQILNLQKCGYVLVD